MLIFIFEEINLFAPNRCIKEGDDWEAENYFLRMVSSMRDGDIKCIEHSEVLSIIFNVLLKELSHRVEMVG